MLIRSDLHAHSVTDESHDSLGNRTMHSASQSLAVAAILLLLSGGDAVSEVESSGDALTRHQTGDGIEYGVWGTVTTEPAPTIFMLAGTIESTLEKPYFRQCGNELAKHGFLVVSIDLPCHGSQTGEGRPAGLGGWSQRIGNDEDIVAEANARLSKVLDHLIETGVTDPDRIAVGGTSRGGFLAIHFAAHDHRVKCAAGFAPVTDLAALSEFRDRQDHPLVLKLSVVKQAEKLAGRPVWIVIGDRDDRVGTQKAVQLASHLSEVARQLDIASNVELHVMSESRGHTTPHNPWRGLTCTFRSAGAVRRRQGSPPPRQDCQCGECCVARSRVLIV